MCVRTLLSQAVRLLYSVRVHLNTVLDGKYRIEGLLGEGGNGSVYRAWQMNLDRPVAVKLLHAERNNKPTAVERFKREALTVARLRHPNIVTVFDFGFEPGVGYFLVQELIGGGSLGDEIAAHGRIDWVLAIALLRQICSAVQAAHALGVIHRDLKPQNVLLDNAGSALLPKVLDFGIARLRDDASGSDVRLTRDGAMIGTPLYMSPEQFNGEVADERSDIYSLGCLLHEMLVGEPPFLASSFGALSYKHVHEAPRLPSGLVAQLPASLDAIVLKALAKAPGERFQSASELAHALGASSVDLGATTQPVDSNTNEMAPARAADTRAGRDTVFVGNLPEPLTTFVGRERDIAAVRSLMESARLATVAGPGGIGKTRLTLQVASTFARAFAHGVWFVELASITSGTQVAQAFASTLGVADDAHVAPAEAVVEYLRGRNALLAVDNCEHVRDAVAELVGAILRAAPGVRVLASSQATLGVPGEAVYRLAPLSLPDLDTAPTATSVLQSEAARLFADRARLNNPAFALTDRDAGVVSEICARLDGIPLAIELAAARTRVLALDDLLARLNDRFRLLRGGSSSSERRQTLAATLDWSYGLLDAREQTLLRRLAVFAGGFSLASVEEVCWGQGIDERDVLDLLERLVDRSLVVVRATGGSVRYDLLETIRQYGRERLEDANELVRLRALHRGWCLRLAEAAGQRINGPEQGEWIARLDLEHDNLIAAMYWSTYESGDADTTLRLCTALGRYWSVRVRWRQGQTILENALAAFPNASPGLVAEALYWLGTFAHKQSRLPQAIDVLERASALKRAAKDPRGEALVHQRLASVLREIGQTDRAEALFAENLAVFRSLGEGRLAAISINCLGAIAADRGDNAQAIARFEEALPLVRAEGDRAAECLFLSNLGECAFRIGRYDDAEKYLQDCLAMVHTYGTGEMIPDATIVLGRIAAKRGDFAAAEALCRRAVDVILERRRQTQLPMALSNMARIADEKGDLARAALLAATATAMREQMGTTHNNEAGADWDEWLARVQGALGARPFDALLARARGLSFDAALAEALK